LFGVPEQQERAHRPRDATLAPARDGAFRGAQFLSELCWPAQFVDYA
jgi:hypothetical protein